MEKLLRFMIIALLFLICFIVLYSLLPFTVWVFGGSFKEVAQSVPYVLFGGVTSAVTIFHVFDNCFNDEYKAKR